MLRALGDAQQSTGNTLKGLPVESPLQSGSSLGTPYIRDIHATIKGRLMKTRVELPHNW
jgi:hypothetical protein